MKKLISPLISLLIIGTWTTLGQAFTLVDLKDQFITQTKLTITKSGGPALFYDASLGDDPSLKEGVIDHVLTNRFITADLGWFTSDNKESVLVGGPGIVLNEAVSTLAPSISETLKRFVPQLLEPLNIGLFCGWTADRGDFRWGGSLVFNFGK